MISIPQIATGLAEYFGKKKMKVTGSTLFDYISKEKLVVEDKILDAIADNKTIKNQSTIVLEYFTKQFKDIEVIDSNKNRVTEIVQSTHKLHHIPFSSLTPKSIAFTSVLLGREMGDLNLFKKKIKDWDENYYQEVLGQFLFTFLVPTKELEEAVENINGSAPHKRE